MLSSAVPVFILSIFASIASSTDYCDPQVCTVPPNPVYKNIGCGATDKLGPKCPPDAKYIKFTAEHKKIILDEHNKLRNKIAGGDQNGFSTASRMSTMKWNDEFEFLASANVRRCIYEHDKCRNIDGIKFAGQNLYTFAGTGSLPDSKQIVNDAVNFWYSEVENATQANIDKCCDSQYVVGHFTQVVSDLADQVGCGLVQFKDQNNWNKIVMACDYSRTNLDTQTIYKSGPTASECKSGTNPNYPNLCSESETVDPNTFIFS
jgi:hypothetical protein